VRAVSARSNRPGVHLERRAQTDDARGRAASRADQHGLTALELTDKPSAELVPGAELVVHPCGPHGLYVSHRERSTADPLRFLGA